MYARLPGGGARAGADGLWIHSKIPPEDKIPSGLTTAGCVLSNAHSLGVYAGRRRRSLRRSPGLIGGLYPVESRAANSAPDAERYSLLQRLHAPGCLHLKLRVSCRRRQAHPYRACPVAAVFGKAGRADAAADSAPLEND